MVEVRPEASSWQSMPLAGNQVRGLSASPALRDEVQTAVDGMGLLVDHAGSVDEAQKFCTGGLPHAMLYDGRFTGEALGKLQAQLHEQAPDLVFIEIKPQGERFAASTDTAAARVGADALRGLLPAALAFELTRSL